MKQIVKSLGFLAALLPSLALAQTLPPNTVVGRLSISPGPSQAIPFTTLRPLLRASTGPATTAIGHLATWADTAGLTLADFNGTSGGVPYFTSTGAIGSSALLTQYGVMYGGGANSAPLSATPGTNNQAFMGNTGAPPSFRSLVGADLPNPSASSLGGIQSIAASPSQWIDSISTAGVPHLSRPACADLSNSAASCATDTTTQANVSFTGLSAAAAASDTDTFPTNQGAGNLKQTLGAIKTWIKSWIAKADVGLGNVANVDQTNATNITSGTLGAGRLPAFSGVVQTSAGSAVTSYTNANANTMLSNWGATAAAPTFNTIPACSNDGAHALVYVNGTGLQCVALAGGAASGNPTSSIGLTAVNGVATTYMRSDGAPSLSQSIAPTWTGLHTWSSGGLVLNGAPPYAGVWHWGGDVAAQLWFSTANGTVPGSVNAATTTKPEILMNLGINSSVGSANPTTAYKIAFAPWVIANSTSADVYAVNGIAQGNTGFAGRLIGNEQDMNQSSGTNHNYTNLGTGTTSTAYNAISGGSNDVAAAMWIFSAGTGKFANGIAITSALSTTDGGNSAFQAIAGGYNWGRALGTWTRGVNFFGATITDGPGSAFISPNNNGLGGSNAAGNATVPIATIDTSNNVVLGGAGGNNVVAALPLKMNGSIITAIRTITASGPVTVSATTDYFVCINKTTGAATTVNLPSSPATGLTFLIKDCKGDAATNNITITPASGNIDGATTYVLSTNRGSVAVTYDGTQWEVN